jgi:hypothetical protein
MHIICCRIQKRGRLSRAAAASFYVERNKFGVSIEHVY